MIQEKSGGLQLSITKPKTIESLYTKDTKKASSKVQHIYRIAKNRQDIDALRSAIQALPQHDRAQLEADCLQWRQQRNLKCFDVIATHGYVTLRWLYHRLPEAEAVTMATIYEQVRCGEVLP